MKKFVTVLLSVLVSVSSLFSQSTKEEELKKNGEIYFRFEISSTKDISWLTNIISIDDVKGMSVFAYANKQEIAKFEETGIPYIILPHPNEGFDPVMKEYDEFKGTDAWDAYPTYDAYITMMNAFEANYPGLCDVFSIGTSINGRQLLVAKISDNVGTDEAEPEFFYTSSIHGDELTGYVLMLRLIDSLLTTYSTSTNIANLVNNTEIYINPLANPDGTYYGGNNTVSGARRGNANNIDMNRNYPDPQDGPHPDGYAWQQETVLFMNFAESRHFVMSANFHGGVEVANYPWDTWPILAADDNWWQYVCHEYADMAQANSPAGYFDYLNDGITNGYAWYEVAGGRQDYMNYFHQCRELTLEISNTKLLPAAQLPAFWNYNRKSLLNYLDQCRYGIRGMITDANTGLPVDAEVYVLNHEADSSWVYSSHQGNYHRLLYAGTYNVRISAPCYETQVINNISVVNKTATILNIQLVPLSNAVDFTASSTNIIAGNTVAFTDQSCGNPYSWLWNITGPGTPVYVSGTTNTSQNPVVQFNTAGSYTVSLTATGAGGSYTKTKTNYINVTNCTVSAFPWSEGFENGGNIPNCWSQEFVSGTLNWIYQNGGYSGHPAAAHGGSYNALLFKNSTSSSVTKLVTPPINLSLLANPVLTFWHAQALWSTDQDELRVYYKTSAGGTWNLLQTYTSNVTAWTQRTINLPGTSNTYYIAFQGTAKYGYGVCIDDVTVNGTLIPLVPVANFSANNTNPFIGQTVTFTDLSTNTPTSWAWSFSPATITYTGGTTSSSQNPQVIFNAGGSYNVTLTASNASGSDPETKAGYINVVFAPVANFSADITSPIAGQTVTFTDISVNTPTSWSWSFDPNTINYTSGTTSASQNPQVQFNSGGFYSVTLIAANGSGSDPETKVNYISVTAAPVADFITSNVLPFVNEAVTFTDMSVNSPVSWNWIFTPPSVTYLGGTNGTSQNPQVQFDAPGNYSVQLTASNAAGSDTEIKSDYINVQALDFYIDVKVMLEGGFNGTDMNTGLSGLSSFPLAQPYSTAPWYYPGMETVINIPSNVVDWVLVELRDATDAATATTAARIARQAAILLSDGSVVGIDGISNLQFNNSIIEQLFVVVWHRNHLPVLSASPLVKTSNTYSYDFSSEMEQAYGSEAQKFLSAGIYGLIGGDANADGSVDNLDKDIFWNLEAGKTGYLGSDLDLDGQSGNADKNDVWLPNFGTGLQLP